MTKMVRVTTNFQTNNNVDEKDDGEDEEKINKNGDTVPRCFCGRAYQSVL